MPVRVDLCQWCGAAGVEGVEFAHVQGTCHVWMDDEVTLSARRNITANEELTIDYAMFEAKEEYTILEKCACGASKCRGRITGKDWRRRDLQEQYGGHFSPFINRRIAASRN